MKLYILLYFLLLIYIPCRSQYIINETKNDYLKQLIKKQTNAKEVTRIFYNKYAESPNGKYYPYIVSKGKINYLSNGQDSLKILNYLISNDTLFNGINLMELARTKKAIALNYSQPELKYEGDSIYKIQELHNTICTEFEKTYTLDFNIYFTDSTKPFSACSQEVTFIIKEMQFFEAYLEIKKKGGKISQINIKAITMYIPFKNPTNNDYLGLAGLCCFILKK